jgi:hypothetical protein
VPRSAIDTAREAHLDAEIADFGAKIARFDVPMAHACAPMRDFELLIRDAGAEIMRIEADEVHFGADEAFACVQIADAELLVARANLDHVAAVRSEVSRATVLPSTRSDAHERVHERRGAPRGIREPGTEA